MTLQILSHRWPARPAAIRSVCLIALIAIGALSLQPARAGCGQFHAARSAISYESYFGESPPAVSVMKANYLKIADQGTYGQWGELNAPIVGLWTFTYTAEGNVGAHAPPDGTVIDGGNTAWYLGGNEMTSSAMRAPDTGSICMGVWKRTGEWTYELNHIGQSWDPVKNLYVGPAFIKQYVTLEEGANKYFGAFFITQYAADGKTVLMKAKGVITATRVTIDTE
jgi:hypothetical protein